MSIVPNQPVKLAHIPQLLKQIESKWKYKLERKYDRIKTRDAKSSRYVLAMFPYPSGNLHLGHVRTYVSCDILARYSRLRGHRVINPMGFDSFGLPAENAAKERNLDPKNWTNMNILTMKQQMDSLALQFDWRQATSNPNYYKWTQDLFLKLLDANLAYKSYASVNWDPIDKTVLADEQVDESGRSWRSGAKVEKKLCRQWFIKVNAFTSDIYDAKDVDLEAWTDIVAIQKSWIGKPNGWLFYLPVSCDKSSDIVPIFTKNPELLANKSAKLVIPRNHWLERIFRVSSKGSFFNPFIDQQIQIELTDDLDNMPPNGYPTMSLLSGLEPSGAEVIDRDAILQKAQVKGFGGFFTSDKYRDWLVSRQRYWGTPIPVINCKSCGFQAASRESLPVSLPHIQDFSRKLRDEAASDGEEHKVSSPLEQLAPDDWLHVKCPSCGSNSTRDCETLDTLFDSSWYFLRYATEPDSSKAFDADKVSPVWTYIGGKEHAAMHLFYARFMTHFLHSQGSLKFREPFDKLLVQGFVKGKTYTLPDGKYIAPTEVANNPQIKSIVTEGYEKMSKSKGNGVDPQQLLDTYGIDSTRFCLMSYANPRSARLWRSNEEEFHDVMLHLRKLINLIQSYAQLGQELAKSKNFKNLTEDELEESKQDLIGTRANCAVDSIYYLEYTNEFRQFIAALLGLIGVLHKNLSNSSVYTKEYAECMADLLIMFNPMTPHLSEELWTWFVSSKINPLRTDANARHKVALQVSDQSWPTFEPERVSHLRRLSVISK